HVEIPWRAAAPTWIHPYVRVTMRYPSLRVNSLKTHILQTRTFAYFWEILEQGRKLIVVMGARVRAEWSALTICIHVHDHWILAIFRRSKYINSQHGPIVHFYRHVPLDSHSVSDFGFVELILNSFFTAHSIPSIRFLSRLIIAFRQSSVYASTFTIKCVKF